MITTLKLMSNTTQEIARSGELASTSFADPSFGAIRAAHVFFIFQIKKIFFHFHFSDKIHIKSSPSFYRGDIRTYLQKYLSDLRAAQRQILPSDTVDNGFVQSTEKLTMKDNSEAFFNHGLFKMHAHAPPICGSVKDNPLAVDMTTFGSSEHLRIMKTSDFCNLSTKRPKPGVILSFETTTTVAANGYQVSFTSAPGLILRLFIRNMCYWEQWSLHLPFHI